MMTDDRRISLLLLLCALALYAPGMFWGLPHATGPDRVLAWGSDEIGTLGPVAELYSVFVNPERFNPQYPLFHYVVMAAFVLPYLGLLAVSGGFATPSADYPYGFADPVTALAIMTLLARVASLLMGAGVVVLSWRIVATLWDRRTGWIAGLIVLLSFPMVFYSRTSNTDVPGLFWTAAGFWVYALVVTNGLTTRRAMQLGVFAGLAVATKDAFWACFLALALALLPLQYRAEGSLSQRLRPLTAGLLTAAGIYALASGLVIRPTRWLQHLDWILNSTAHLLYPRTFAGLWGLLRESAHHLVASLGWIPSLAGFVGVALAVRARRASGLVLGLVTVPLLTIIPVHFVNFRYLLPIVWLLAMLAAVGFATPMRASRPHVRWLGSALLMVGLTGLAVRDADLTWQMWRDARYDAGAWLREHAPAAQVGFFGSFRKLPPVPSTLRWIPLNSTCTRAAWRAAPDLVVVIPQQHFALVHEWEITDEIWTALSTGELGYELVWRSRNRGLFSRLPVPFVNPPVRIYARGQALAAIPKSWWQTAEQPALLERWEQRWFPWTRVPRGLTINPERTPACAAMSLQESGPP